MPVEFRIKKLQQSWEDAGKTRRRMICLGIFGVVALATWRLFHPELEPDITLIRPNVREELAKVGFASTTGVGVVKFKTAENVDGLPGELSAEQSIRAIDSLLTEKRTQRRDKQLIDESIGLFVGPIAVLRLHRNRPPIIGGILPYHFWSTSRIIEFQTEQIDQFPVVVGGVLRAKVTYEDTYADGKLAQTERVAQSGAELSTS